jgi:hypothetical protein
MTPNGQLLCEGWEVCVSVADLAVNLFFIAAKLQKIIRITNAAGGPLTNYFTMAEMDSRSLADFYPGSTQKTD